MLYLSTITIFLVVKVAIRQLGATLLILYVEAEGAKLPAARVSSFLPLLEQYLSAACDEIPAESSSPPDAENATLETGTQSDIPDSKGSGDGVGAGAVERKLELELVDAMGALHDRDRYVYTLLTLLFRMCSHAQLISSAHFEELLVRLFRMLSHFLFRLVSSVLIVQY